MSVSRWGKAHGAVVIAALLGMPLGAAARSHAATPATKKPGKAAKDATERGIRDGDAALKTGDLAGAERLLSEAYRTHGSPLALFHLGRVAQAQGRAVAAQDFMRRFLDATEGQAGPPEQRGEAERVLATKLPTGEVAVLGEPGGRVVLDGRLVALLPLPLPLLVAPGLHEVRLELVNARSAAPFTTSLTVKAEHRVEVRFERATAAVMVSELPTVMLLVRSRGGPDTTEARVEQAVIERLRGQRLTVLTGKMREAAGCTDGPRCQLATLTERSLDHAVLVDVELLPAGAGEDKPAASPAKDGPLRQDFRFTVSLLDAQVGEVAHRVEQRCDHCTLDLLVAQVASASSDVAAQGLNRRRGDLEVLSEPPGALLELSGRVVGPTPYHGVRFAGSYAAVLRHPGYRELSQPIVVEEGKPAQLRVRLEPQVTLTAGPTNPLSRVQRVHFVELAPRPTWRLLLGGGLIAGGALTAGFGAGALAVDGQCLQPAIAPAQQCEHRYQTMPLGVGLVSAGAAVSLLGVVLMAVPGPRRHYESTVTLSPCAASGTSQPAGGATQIPLCANREGR